MTETLDVAEGGVVVGYDGSPPAKGAVEWAATYAELVGTHLDLVIAWEYPTSWGTAIPLPDGYDPETDARAVVEPVVVSVRLDHPGLDVHSHIAKGRPGEVLVTASRRSSLLVVACRGHGSLTGVLLGSVSLHCATEAACPVVVYRHPEPA